MKCKNTITGNVFEIEFEEGKKLLEEYDCFEIIEAPKSELEMLSNQPKNNLTIKERVMKSARKECKK